NSGWSAGSGCRGVRSCARVGAALDDALPAETSQAPFFVRRACTSPSGVSRCTLRALASSSSSRAGHCSRGTVSVREPSTTFTAAPRRTSTGVAVTPSTTSFLQPSPSARSSSCSMYEVCQPQYLELRRPPVDERCDHPEVVGRLWCERGLRACDRREPGLPFDPLRPDTGP